MCILRLVLIGSNDGFEGKRSFLFFCHLHSEKNIQYLVTSLSHSFSSSIGSFTLSDGNGKIIFRRKCSHWGLGVSTPMAKAGCQHIPIRMMPLLLPSQNCISNPFHDDAVAIIFAIAIDAPRGGGARPWLPHNLFMIRQNAIFTVVVRFRIHFHRTL